MSTTFLDGPAQGTRLSLQRAPIFLRVVIDADGTVDALDQLSDQPTATEKISVYHLAGEPSHFIACSRGKGGGCRRGVIAEYRLHPEQPTDEEARDFEKWAAWVANQAKKEGG